MKAIGRMSLGVLALLVASCAKVPEAAIDAARAAVDAALKAEAPTYAAEALARAQGLLESMEAEVAAQAARSGLSRSYKNGTALAGQAAEAANQAAEAAVKGREQAIADVARMIPEVERGLADAEAKVRQARAASGAGLDISQLEAQLEAGERSLDEAKKDQSAHRFMDSRNKLQAISDALAAAARIIDEATKARR